MKFVRALKMVLATGLVVSCIALMSACTDLENSTAATVGSYTIKEGEVTQQIQRLRSQTGLTDDDTWGRYLAQSGVSPESIRETVINYLVEQYVVVEASDQLGIEVNDDEVTETINSFKQYYKTDKAWQTALEQAGFTEDSYRETVTISMVQQKVAQYFQDQTEPSDEDYLDAAKAYASYYDGAKRSSHILIAVTNTNDPDEWAQAKEKADNVLGQVKSGALSFEAAVAEYSDDTGSKVNGGDVGWDKMSQFITEYTDGLNQLEVDEISSEPVQSQYGYHIIKCTEKFSAPAEGELVSIEQIPDASQDQIRELAVSTLTNKLYSNWIAEVKETVEITINPMPKGLPYDVDISKYETASSANDGSYSLTTGNSDADAAFGGTSEDEAIMEAAEQAETNPDGSAHEELTVDVEAEGSAHDTSASKSE